MGGGVWGVASRGDVLATRLTEKAAFIDAQRLEFSLLAAEFAQTDHYDRDGATSPIGWIRQHCHMTSNDAANSICVGEVIASLPFSQEAMERGRIGFKHITFMARTAEFVGKSFDERPLLKQAVKLNVGRFFNACMKARHAAHPAAFADGEKTAVEMREFSISSPDDFGMVHLDGRVDAAGGAAIRSALEPLARKLGKDDDRPLHRRMADAFIELAQHSLDAGLIPNHASQRAHLQVTSTLETLLGVCGAPAAGMEFSLPISSKSVERLACDCNVTRILLDSDSMVIDVGRAKRVIAGPTRKALNLRDQHCQWPGCDRPASWSQGHHLVHWIHGGPTDLPNLALLCLRHHWMVHEGGWQIARSSDGTVAVVPPVIEFGATARGSGFHWTP